MREKNLINKRREEKVEGFGKSRIIRKGFLHEIIEKIGGNPQHI